MFQITRSVMLALGWTAVGFLFFAAGPASALSAGSSPADVVTVDFRGGTLVGYVEAIRQATDGANIVVTGVDAQAIPVGAIRLDDVSVESALRAVEQTYPVDDREWVDVRLQTVGPPNQPGKPVYRLGAVRSSVKVWNVLDMFVSKVKPADVLTAVDAAVELVMENDQPARVRFHESTGVLIATGSPRQVNAIEDVIVKLRDRLRSTEIREAVEF